MGDEGGARLFAENEERRRVGVGHHRGGRDDAYGAKAVVDWMARARVYDVRVAAAGDFDEALVAA